MMPHKPRPNNDSSLHIRNSSGDWMLLFGTIVLLFFALGGSLAEFYFQIKYADAIGYTSWPFDWDNNRYVDTARLYLQAFQSDGWHGLALMYANKPPYSITLLLTGLPFLALTGRDSALFASQVIYLLLMDAGVVFAIWRLTGSMRWAHSACLPLQRDLRHCLRRAGQRGNGVSQVSAERSTFRTVCRTELADAGRLYSSRTRVWGIGLALA